MLLVNSKPIREAFGVLETANLLFLKLWLKNRPSARAFPGRVFREYMSLVRRDKWRSADIFELFPALRGERITLEHLPGAGVNTPLDELAYLALLTKAVAPRRVFEIGTFRGKTALNFALNSPDYCEVLTLDLPPEQRDESVRDANVADSAIITKSLTGVDCQGKDVSHKIRQLYGNSLRFDFSPYYRNVDIVFVDGAHHYSAALSDTQNALRMVRRGGVVIWHDFANYGDYNDVTRAALRCVPGDQIFQIDSSQLAVYRAPADPSSRGPAPPERSSANSGAAPVAQ